MRLAAITLCAAISIAGLLPAAEFPRPIPAMTFQASTGAPIDLAKYKGKCIVVAFFSTTCPHCQKSSVIWERIYKEYAAKGVQVVAFATNVAEQSSPQLLVANFSKTYQLTFPVGFTKFDNATKWLQHPIMQTLYVPQLAFVDRKGMIREQHGGDDPFFMNEETNIRTVLDKLLKEPGAAPAKPAAAAKPPAKKTS